MNQRDELAEQGELLKASTVARTFGVEVRTLWNWERRGVLVPVTRVRGQRYYRRSDVERMIGHHSSESQTDSINYE
jgi:predicted site-specific integrase-resolvase